MTAPRWQGGKQVARKESRRKRNEPYTTQQLLVRVITGPASFTSSTSMKVLCTVIKDFSGTEGGLSRYSSGTSANLGVLASETVGACLMLLSFR
eukprot:Skav202053  [mRNA]  locus=scaffold1138:496569:497717:+ [translate_table: standard]